MHLSIQTKPMTSSTIHIDFELSRFVAIQPLHHSLHITHLALMNFAYSRTRHRDEETFHHSPCREQQKEEKRTDRKISSGVDSSNNLSHHQSVTKMCTHKTLAMASEE